MLQFPPLFESMAPKIVGRTLKLAEWETIQQMRAVREMCLDYYHDEVLSEDGGQDKYLKDFFRVWDGERNVWVDAKGVVLEHVPLTPQLINLKARIYAEQPERKIRVKTGKPKPAAKYEELLKRSGFPSTAKAIERYTQLLGDVAVGVFLDEETKFLRFIVAPEYYPLFEEDDPLQLEPTAVIYPTAQRTKSGEVVWVYMDAEVKLKLTPDGTQQGREEENTYRHFNWFFPHREKPVLSYYGSPRKALVVANQSVDVAMTALNKLMRYNGFKQVVLQGKVDPTMARDFVLGNTVALTLEPGMGETLAPTADVLDMQADFAAHIEAIKFKMEAAANAMNMAFQWKMDGGGVASGRALEVMNVRDYEDRKGMVEVFTEQVEVPLHRIAVAISKRFSLGVEDGDLIVDFPEQESGFPDANAEIAWRNHEIERGLKTPIDYIREDNPDMDEAEAAALWENNLKLNRMMASPGDALEENILAILRDEDGGTFPGGEGDTGVPGARGGVSGAIEDRGGAGLAAGEDGAE